MRITLVIFALLFASAFCTICRKTQLSVREAFVRAKISDIVGAPDKLIEVSYSCGIKVNLGNKVTPTQANGQPIVKWEADPNKFYTLIMIDLDSPGRDYPLFREAKHWIVGNICGNVLSTGEEIISYLGPIPFSRTGWHRLVFLVFEQPGRIDYSSEPKSPNASPGSYINFSTRDFAAKYCLNGPIAGNFFVTQYDNSVSKILLNLNNNKKIH